MATRQSWQEIVAEKRIRQKQSIPQDWLASEIPAEGVLDVTDVVAKIGKLSALDLQITDTVDVGDLLRKLASGEWSSVAVTTAFYKRAIIAQQLTNCLTEIFVERALARAAEVDEYLRTHGKPMGPLHGLPISLKDQLCMKGLETTMGYVSWIGKYAEHDAVLVQILYEAGAVPFVRTNVPQTLMWPETFNNIFGRTSNPYNRSLTSGGSSGGEGALIALRGSPLGIGSDIGGSIRIPASFCGLYGLRPSYHRIPYAGAMNSMEGQDTIASVFGPLSGSLAGIEAFMRAVIDAKPWERDAQAVRKVWDEDSFRLADHGRGGKLCIGIMWHDGITVPHPPVMRGLELVKSALIAAGHEVIDWKALKSKEIYDTIAGIWGAGSARDYAVVIGPSGEPLIETMNLAAHAPSHAQFRPPPGDEGGISAYELWQLHRTRRNIRQEYLEMWQRTKERSTTGRPMDAIIAPTAPYVAPPHGKNKDAGLTLMWNLLDYPALVIPVAKLDQSLDARRPAHEFLSETDKKNHAWYDPVTFNNAPISLQLVGRTLEEEAIIGMGKIVDEAVRKFMKGQSGESKL